MEESKQMEGQDADKMLVSPEELEALGIPKGVSMTRSELNKHMETPRFHESQEVDPTQALARAMTELTEEEIRRAEEAGRRREESGK